MQERVTVWLAREVELVSRSIRGQGEVCLSPPCSVGSRPWSREELFAPRPHSSTHSLAARNTRCRYEHPATDGVVKVKVKMLKYTENELKSKSYRSVSIRRE